MWQLEQLSLSGHGSLSLPSPQVVRSSRTSILLRGAGSLCLAAMERTNKNSSSNGVRVCVTGGAGFIGSWLVKKLLERGYTVHATLRNIEDDAKSGLLRRLVPGAAESGRLVLFEADLYDAATFAPAIAGCQFVFLVATPLQHDATSTKYKSTAEAALDAARVILRQCEESRTVKRVIHTGSMGASSPLKEDSTGFKDAVDESCWTPLDVDYPPRNAVFNEYLVSKLVSEKELLAYNAAKSPAFEVVTLPCSIVAGDTLQGHGTFSLNCLVSPVTRDVRLLAALRQQQPLVGSVPMTHVDDVCDALVFCMERPAMAGRFLCAAAYPTFGDVVGHFAAKYPHGRTSTSAKRWRCCRACKRTATSWASWGSDTSTGWRRYWMAASTVQ